MKKLLKRLFPDTHPLRIVGHRLKNQLIALLCSYPAKKLTVLSVTGSDGKTTTVGMIAHILKAQGIKAGAVSTAFFEIDGARESNPTQKTSVGTLSLQKFLRRLVRSGCTHAVIEASSHGLMQGRLAGIIPNVAVLTNLSMEHLDYHGTMEEYMLAKSLLFRAMKGRGTKVLNTDDRTYIAYQGIHSDATVSFGNTDPIDSSLHLRATNVQVKDHSVSATVQSNDKTIPLSLQIPGTFNIDNALAAMAACSAVGVSVEQSAKALQSFEGVSGRMEPIICGQPYRVYVDFTVTPRAYEQTLMTLKKSLPSGSRLLVLAGSCGDRMREKRPLVGEICTRLAKLTVITNEDPYTEDPEKIIDEVLAGVPKSVPIFRGTATYHSAKPAGHACVRLSDRMEAILFLLDEAASGDAVFFAGKGSDVTMMVKGGQIPWNEREILKTELERRISNP